MTYTLDRPSGPLAATPEQIRIIDAVLQTDDNILISALAGAAKSTTLEFICKYKTGIPILSLAFNKRIAEELATRLPSHVQCRTLNALGHRVWMSGLGSTKVVLDSRKTYGLVKEWGDTLGKADKQDFYDVMSLVMRAVDSAKMSGYIPPSFASVGKPIHTHLDLSQFDEPFDGEIPDWLADCINTCLADSIRQAYKGRIDFNDQIYMPTLFGGTFPSFPLVMVDEAQDLSPINHVMLQRLAKQRLIAVGDPWQSIYGFRGAVSNGMTALQRTFKMTELGLSVSFRCPQAVVRKAQERVPHMRWPDWAIEGEVERLDKWSAKHIPDGAAIICRNNAPLFACALALIRSGRGVKILGADIGPSLIKLLKKLGPLTLPQADLITAIERWRSEKLQKSKAVGSIEDKAECLRVFAFAAPTLSGAIAFAEHIFEQGGTIQLMSGHKSKGLEFDTVYHLDPWRVPSKYAREGEGLEQELNVRYVIETRAKRSLYLVTLEGLDVTR